MSFQLKALFILSVNFSLGLLAKDFVSQKHKVPLIELYSSEGCSSCPPAERQIGSWVNNKDLWTKFVPLNFHVDYWDYLGWVDRFGNKKFAARQRGYAALWKKGTVYTPAFVLNAKKVGSRLDINKITSSKKSSKALVSLKAKVDKSHRITIVAITKSSEQYQIHVALLGNGLVSDVKRGENAGAKLVQNFVVLDQFSGVVGKKALSYPLQLKKNTKPKALAFAAWITKANGWDVIQSMGGYL